MVDINSSVASDDLLGSGNDLAHLGNSKRWMRQRGMPVVMHKLTDEINLLANTDTQDSLESLKRLTTHG